MTRRALFVDRDGTGTIMVDTGRMTGTGRITMLDSEGGRFWDPDADRACFDAIRRGVRPGIPVIEVDANINDPAFSGRVAETLLEMLAAR